jgi:zinc transporter, ZIP family
VSTAQTIALGLVAGLTIFLGLPMGRIKGASLGLKTFLNGTSAGILVFLFFDILEHSTEEVVAKTEAFQAGTGSFGQVVSLAAVNVLAFGVGLLSLLYVQRLWRRREARQSLGPGAMAVAEAHAPERDALRLGMSIAIGIGLHNFSEGLAIGQSAHSGEVALALLLVIGFAAHNATEGFGIVGPLAAADVRPSWGWLALVGLIAGGPTFIGTLVGTAFASTVYVSVAFLSLAAGAILYVIGELFSAGRRLSWEITLWGVLAGFTFALATELILVAAGA